MKRVNLNLTREVNSIECVMDIDSKLDYTSIHEEVVNGKRILTFALIPTDPYSNRNRFYRILKV